MSDDVRSVEVTVTVDPLVVTVSRAPDTEINVVEVAAPLVVDVTYPGPAQPVLVDIKSIGGLQGPRGPAGPQGVPGKDYTLPVASTTILGGVKVDGNSIVITDTGVISSAGTDFPEAPLDNVTYGRHQAAWRQVIAATGDIVDGGNF